MKYLCLVCHEEIKLDALSGLEIDALRHEHQAYEAALRQSGNLLAAQVLCSARSATTVRVRNGRVMVTDGPFAETKEQLGRLYLIEAGDLNDAIRVAARNPSARIGSVEVRPVDDAEPAARSRR